MESVDRPLTFPVCKSESEIKTVKKKKTKNSKPQKRCFLHPMESEKMFVFKVILEIFPERYGKKKKNVDG